MGTNYSKGTTQVFNFCSQKGGTKYYCRRWNFFLFPKKGNKILLPRLGFYLFPKKGNKILLPPLGFVLFPKKGNKILLPPLVFFLFPNIGNKNIIFARFCYPVYFLIILSQDLREKSTLSVTIQHFPQRHVEKQNFDNKHEQ